MTSKLTGILAGLMAAVLVAACAAVAQYRHDQKVRAQSDCVERCAREGR